GDVPRDHLSSPLLSCVKYLSTCLCESESVCVFVVTCACVCVCVCVCSCMCVFECKYVLYELTNPLEMLEYRSTFFNRSPSFYVYCFLKLASLCGCPTSFEYKAKHNWTKTC